MHKLTAILFLNVTLILISCESPSSESDSKLTNLEDSIGSLNDEILNLKDSLNALQDRPNDALQGKPNDNGQVDSSSFTINQNTQQLRKLHLKIDSLTNVIQNNKVKVDNVDENIKPTDSLKFVEFGNSLKAARERLLQQDMLAQNLKDQLNTVKSENANLVKQLNALKSTNSSVNQLKLDSIRLSSQLKESNQMVSTLQSKNQELTQKLSEPLTTTDETSRIDSLKSLLQIAAGKNQELLKEIEILTEKSNATNRVSTNAEVQLNTSPKNPDEKLSEAFRLLLLAQTEEHSDPTLALKLLTLASQLANDSIITAHKNRVQTTYNFYNSYLITNEPIKGMTIGANRMVLLSQGDKAKYYRTDSASTPILLDEFKKVISAYISHEKKGMILGQPDGFMTLYDINREQIIKKKKAHDSPLTQVSILGNPQYFFVTGSSDKSLKVWDNRYNQTARMVGMKDQIISIDPNPRTGQIAVACGDLNPRIWSASGKLLLKLDDQPDSTLSVSLSPSGGYLLSTHSDNSARLWKDGAMISVTYHQAPVTCSVFISEKRYATGDKNGIIKLWETGQLKEVLKGHKASISALCTDNKGDFFSSSLDGNVFKWLSSSAQLHYDLTESEKKRFNIL